LRENALRIPCHLSEVHMTRPRSRRIQALGAALAALLCLTTAATAAHGQSASITGRVASDQGNSLEVANVFISEMNISVGTNAEGRYTITIPAERVRGQTVLLRVRALGYSAQSAQITIRAGSQTKDFALKKDINRLQEVVVTGVTGATEQKKLAFTVTQVNEADMPVPASNALTQLQGKVPGAQIVMPSGRPGAAPSIVLRGPKSLNAAGRSQGPLIIVDGIVLNGGTQDINPLDIESVEVVKGAAASSLYGSRAGAGVIQITTKSGKNAQPGVRFALRSETGFSDIQGEYPYATRHFLMMDEKNEKFCVRVTGQPACSRVVDFEAEALRVNDVATDYALAPIVFERDYGIGASPTKPELKGLFMINQWPKRYNPIEQVATASLYNQSNLDMSGRFGNTGYFVSASNEIDQGSVKYLKGGNRNSARLNLDQKVGEQWSVQLQSFYSRRKRAPDGEWFRLTRVPAAVDLTRTDSKGRLFIRSNPLNQGSQNENPLYDNQNRYQTEAFDRFLGSLTTKYTPFGWLDVEANGSIDRSRYNYQTLSDRGFRSTSPGAPINLGRVTAGSSSDLSYNLSLNSTARHNFGNDLQSRLNLRYTYEQQDGDNIDASANTLAVPGLLSLDNGTTSILNSSDMNSVRALGASAGIGLEFKERYIFDAVYRYDGSSLFGANQRWHPYGRVSLAWRVSDEPFWFLPSAINDFKLRGSYGTAGGRPRFSAQYETFGIGTGGLVTANALGNKDLKPETTAETEVGFDAEILGKYGLTVTFARDITRDQIIQVPPPVSSGFATQWKNAGTLDGKTWEVSLNVPVVTTKNLTWTSRVGWDRNRTEITALGVPGFFQSSESSTYRYAVGERLGTIYGKRFLTSCAQFPAEWQAQCGPGKEWQKNDQGFISWIGTGNTSKEGVTKNLWQAIRPGCLKAGAVVNVTGEVDCRKAGGTVNSPWGIPDTHWGMLTVFRDSTAAPVLQQLGNTLPDWRLTFSQNLQFKKFNLYALVDHSHGNDLMNEELHWSLGDFNVRDEDQDGKTVENAKPLGYYWRAPRPDHAAGVGGMYDVLGSNNITVESGQYTKIREITLSYNIGRLPVLGLGDWTLSLIGRNLYTFTDFKGWDPEVGITGGNLNTAAVNAVAAYQYPQRRTFTVSVNTRF
jgi:TonB-linked SusC/RagA family outer membrane protein